MSNLPNKTLRLYNFRDYYNRIIERLETVEEYDTKGHHLHTLTAANFNPNDDVSTQHVFNFEPEDGIFPDYMLLCSENNDIISRWWIVDTVRTRNGQYNMTLLRDVVADYYQETLAATTFIEKAKLGINDPLIFNSENMDVNQIRQEPELITDVTKMPWVVGYIPKDAPETELATNIRASRTFIDNSDIHANWIEPDILDSDIYKNQGKLFLKPGVPAADDPEKRIRCVFKYNSGLSINDLKTRTYDFYPFFNINTPYPQLFYNEVIYNATTSSISDLKNTPYCTFRTPYGAQEVAAQFIQDCFSQNKYQTDPDTSGRYALQQLLYSMTDVGTEIFQPYNALIKDGDYVLDEMTNTYYRITMKQRQFKKSFDVIEGLSLTSNLYNKVGTIFSNTLQQASNVIDKGFNNTTLSIEIYGVFQYYVLERQVDTQKYRTGFLPPSLRTQCMDAPYDIICAPYYDNYSLERYDSDKQVPGYVDIENVETNKEAAVAILQAFQTTLGSGQVMDIQILPFCPLGDSIVRFANIRKINISDPAISSVQYIYDDSTPDSNIIRGVFFWCSKDNVDDIINLSPISMPTDTIDLKVKSQTEKYRIVSPFYESVYEFNPYKNGGLRQFRYYCKFRPFQPYIKVIPIFNTDSLYGVNTDYDPRGCASTSNYSITQMTDQWANYLQNNSNYQNIFDRQIQSMELNNSVQDTKDIYSATLGTITGAASGATTGLMASGGNVAGAVAGGLVGGISSGIMGGVNLELNRSLRNETIDYTKDQFGYQLGNIKAMPQSVSKLASFTKNTPWFFMLEKYTCTPKEREAFRNKVIYNGMTVMAIGNIQDYIWPDEKTYIKGKLIRINGFHECYHVLNQLASELNKGVFI